MATITNQVSNYGSYKYVVTGTEPGPYHTIASAITQAVSDGGNTTILIRPGTYTENLTLVSGINLRGSDEGLVIISGIHVPPAAGSLSISNCEMSSATHILSSAVFGTTDISFDNCLFNLTAGYIFNMTNWGGDLTINNCTDVSAGNSIIVNTSAAALAITDSSIGNGGTLMTVSGPTTIFNSRIFEPVAFTLQSAVAVDGGSVIDGAIAVVDDATFSIFNSRVSAGADTAITHTSTGLVILENVIIDSSNMLAIDGTGQIELGEVVYNDSHGVAVTITYANASVLRGTSIVANSLLEVVNGDLIMDNGQFWVNGSSGTNGQLIIASTGAHPAFANITSTGGTCTITNGANSINVEVAEGGINWNEATVSLNAVSNNGYIVKIAAPGLLTITLPAVALQGSIIEISGYTAGLWKLAQGAGQSVNFGSVTSTPGVGGSISATNRYDSIRLLCVTANTEWNVLSSVGAFNIV